MKNTHRIVAFLLVLFPVSLAVAQEAEDPNLWLENVDDPKALEWAVEKNEATLAVLQGQPAFEALYEKNLEIYNSDERIAYPSIRGDYLYNFWQDANNERGLWRRTTLASYRMEKPDWETVLDVDALAEAEGQNWVWKGSTCLHPDYTRCMLRLSRGGGDAVVVREYDVDQKAFIDDGFYLPEAKGGVSWVEENTLILSTDFGEGTMTTSGYPRMAKLWTRGTPLTEARTLFEAEEEDMGVWGSVSNTPERDYTFLSRARTFYESDKYVLEGDDLIQLEIPDDADLQGIFKGQMLVMLKSDWTVGGNTYPQGALISIGYDDFLGGGRDFSVIDQPDERSSIVSVSNTRNFLLVNKISNVVSELFQYRFEDGYWRKEQVNAPGYGSISISATDENSDLFFFNYNSFLTPSSLYLVSEGGNNVEPIKQLPDFFDADKFEVKQYEATSKDGTQIPYFLVHARGMKLDGTNPTLLYGYGGFEISMRPSYSATTGTAWLENGGVYALANIRGGGEFGPKWHQSALKENRQRAYDDFIAVAENLIERDVTTPRHLGISGGSNGGLLVGAAFTQRPDLFNAVVCRVPLLDMKRYNKLLAGASWMGEYGDPDIPEEWDFIKEYSPYHNVSKDKTYPKVFFNTSTRDDRVHPGHARKMVALMESMGHEVYYYENTEGGHAAATNNQQRAFSSALIYTYLLQQLR